MSGSEGRAYGAMSKTWKSSTLLVVVFLMVEVVATELPDCQCLLGNVNCDDDKEANSNLAYLQDNCTGRCKSDIECQQRFFQLEQMAYGCSGESIPLNVLNAMHTFDTECEHCREYRPEDTTLTDCPQIQCSAEQINTAWSNFVDDGCRNNCQQNSCEDGFQRLFAAMFMCDPAEVPEILKHNFHWVEAHSCTEQQCNIPREIDCTSSANTRFVVTYGSSEESGLSSGAVTGIVVGAVMAALIIVVGTAIVLRRRKAKDSVFLDMAQQYQT